MSDERKRLLAIVRNVDVFDVERWESIEVAARAALAAWDEAKGFLDLPGPLEDYDKADAPFEQLRQALAATVGGTDQPSPGGAGPTAGK